MTTTSTKAAQATFTRMQDHLQTLRKGADAPASETVAPGRPAYLTAAATINDTIAQGDLLLVVRKNLRKAPKGYKKLAADAPWPTNQLVPGVLQGARHCIENRATVDVYLPEEWNSADPANWSDTRLAGPIFVCKQDTTVVHPVHGHVHCAAGLTIETRYQRTLDVVTQQIRRTQD